MAKRKNKSTKGSLVKGYLEKVPIEIFEAILPQIKDMLKDNSGIYALYKDNKLYYVGLAKNLIRRLSWHNKDRHAGKWNNFSLFIINRTRALKDIETMVLRISKPKGNRIRGKIKEHYEYQNRLRKIAKEGAQKFHKILKNI